MTDKFKKGYPGFKVYPDSVIEDVGQNFFLAEKDGKKFVVSGNGDFRIYEEDEGVSLLVERFPWLKASACGLKRSFGFGDRLGMATPGHIKALEKYGRDFFPIFAQQSVRELERTERSFQDVINSAVIGCFASGYRGGFGADADHIKDTAHLGQAVEAGFTFFTIDPSDRINNPACLEQEKKKAIIERYFPTYGRPLLGKSFKAGDNDFEFTEEALQELVIVYAGGLEHIEDCYAFLKERAAGFDFEVSVDETAVSTTPAAHRFIVEHLNRAGIRFQSLALRFPGSFEKGIDYKGDTDEFKRDIEAHACIREESGDYKISLHSGSDKFSVYPAFRDAFGEKIHVKTAGTSWIEAVKVIAEKDFSFFMEILDCGIKNFGAHSASYEISAEPELLDLVNLNNMDAESIFKNPAIRQIVHISYGTILTGRDSGGDYIYRDRFFKVLKANDQRYSELLREHLGKHLRLLSG